MLVNIVENALDANRQSDRRLVQVTLDCDAVNARIRVADEGGGFRSDALSQSFSPAYTTKITDGFMHGLGLGLFIAHAVATLHGGSIHLANQEMGGALVTITLPLANKLYVNQTL
jgi:C4-dicarboxylate-specific signal transduction histidine kinase